MPPPTAGNTAGALRAVHTEAELHGAVPLSSKLPAFDPSKKFTAADLSELASSLSNLLIFVPADFFYEADEISDGLLGYTAKVVGAKLTDRKNNPSLTLLFHDDDASYYLYPHPRAKAGHKHHYLTYNQVKVLA